MSAEQAAPVSQSAEAAKLRAAAEVDLAKVDVAAVFPKRDRRCGTDGKPSRMEARDGRA
jgi:hypothetical protein